MAVTSVSASITAVTLFAANSQARQRIITNDSVGATLYVKFGTGASSTDYTYAVGPGGVLEFPTMPASPGIYQSVVTGIWTAASGAARCTEV